MLIVQLTDIHIAEAGQRVLGGADPIARAEAAAAWLSTLAPVPDLILLTGDNGQQGTVGEYRELRRIFADSPAPLRVLPGNHDDRDALRTVLGDLGWVSGDGPFIQGVEPVGGLNVVMLDSLDPGQVGGKLCENRLDWLRERLDELSGLPVLIALHHPPFASGMTDLDDKALGGRDALAALIRRHGGVAGVVCGHLHRPLGTLWAGTMGFVAPSAGRQFGLSLIPGHNAGWSDEPAGAALHWWTPENGLVSHVVDIGAPVQP